MTYDKESFMAGLAVGRMLWRPAEPEANLFALYCAKPFTLETAHGEKGWEGIIEYSTGGNWTEWDGSQIEAQNGLLKLRGIGNLFVTSTDLGLTREKHPFVIQSQDQELVYCIGRADVLLNYKTPPIAIYTEAFDSLFLNCTVLASAPALPTSIVTGNSYANMFKGCTSLVAAPALPANPQVGCYSSMFEGCTSLTIPPVFSDGVPQINSHYRMFAGCTSLVVPPALPAEYVGENAYAEMFSGCTALKNPPALPAKGIMSGAYRQMFEGCTSLVSLPKLPSTFLPSECYLAMFSGCTSIKLYDTSGDDHIYPFRIPESDYGDVYGIDQLNNMFSNTGGPVKYNIRIDTTYYTDHPLIG